MASHRLKSDSGHVFEFVVGHSGQIVDMRGDWPAGEEELVFSVGLPTRETVTSAPEHILEWGAVRGWDVCYYDPDACRTCYCDDSGRMRCVGMC